MKLKNQRPGPKGAIQPVKKIDLVGGGSDPFELTMRLDDTIKISHNIHCPTQDSIAVLRERSQMVYRLE
jgi:hypothetical protein